MSSMIILAQKKVHSQVQELVFAKLELCSLKKGFCSQNWSFKFLWTFLLAIAPMYPWWWMDHPSKARLTNSGFSSSTYFLILALPLSYIYEEDFPHKNYSLLVFLLQEWKMVTKPLKVCSHKNPGLLPHQILSTLFPHKIFTNLFFPYPWDPLRNTTVG